MESDSIIIITEDEFTQAGARPLGARSRPVSTHVSERNVMEVRENMSRFLRNLGQILSLGEEVGGDYNIDRIEVNAQITGEGKLGLLGTGVKVGASSGLKIVLQRKGR